jgi:FkbM family methyltransferase
MIRAMAERLSRGVVLRRRLPGDLGGWHLFVSPEGGGLRFWKTDMEQMDPTLFRSVRRLVSEAACVWDVGANMGLFAFAAAARAGPNGFVLAIEADLDNARLLLKSQANMPDVVAHVQVLPCAVAERAFGIEAFEISARARAANSLRGAGLSQKGPVRETRMVPSVSLDELLRHVRSPSVVKIDVEGAELRVLAGAARLLGEVRPAIVIEVESSSAGEVGQCLRGAHYRFFDGDANGAAWTELRQPPWNCHAIPEEKVDAFVRHHVDERPGPAAGG